MARSLQERTLRPKMLRAMLSGCRRKSIRYCWANAIKAVAVSPFSDFSEQLGAIQHSFFEAMCSQHPNGRTPLLTAQMTGSVQMTGATELTDDIMHMPYAFSGSRSAGVRPHAVSLLRPNPGMSSKIRGLTLRIGIDLTTLGQGNNNLHVGQD